MRKQYLIHTTINFKQGEEYDQCSVHGRKQTAKYVHSVMGANRSATSFMFSIARTGKAATPDQGGDVE